MRWIQLLLVVLLGCTQAERSDEGTVVGNPGDAALRMGAVDDGEVIAARTNVSRMSLESCDGMVRDVELDQDVDFFDDVHMDVPNGEWCSLYLFMEETLHVEMVSYSEEVLLTLDLEIEVLEFESADGFKVDGDQAILEWGFPGWLSMDPETLLERLDIDEDDLREREDMFLIEVNPDDGEAHDSLVDVFAYGSGLYGDDGDGELSDEERTDLLWAAGSSHPTGSSEEALDEPTTVVEPGDTMDADAQLSTGPGCAKSDSSLQWALIFPIIFLGWRRDSHPR